MTLSRVQSVPGEIAAFVESFGCINFFKSLERRNSTTIQTIGQAVSAPALPRLSIISLIGRTFSKTFSNAS